LEVATLDPAATAHRDARRRGSRLLATACSSFAHVQRNLLAGKRGGHRRGPAQGTRFCSSPQRRSTRRPRPLNLIVVGQDESQAKEAELFQQIGKLQMELEWLKKKSQLL
jgi:hypothetical protein